MNWMVCKRCSIGLLTVVILMVMLMIGCSNSSNVAPPIQTEAESGGSAGGSEHESLDTIEAIAMYEGADREERLVKAAKEEGELTLYITLPVEVSDQLAKGFKDKYGIQVNLWRSAADNILQRAVTEAKSGHHNFDIVENSSIELEALHRENMLQEIKSPYWNDLLQESIPSHKQWVPAYVNVFVQAYNTNKIKKEELPKTYKDLLDPKWKNMLGIEAGDMDWLSTIVNEMGEEQGLLLFRDLVKTNGLSVRKGHSLLTELVASGEVPLALTVYSYKAEELKQAGAPIDWFALENAVASSFGIAVSNKAPHPNAAVLFFDYMLTDGQKILFDNGLLPTSTKIESDLSGLSVKYVDPVTMLDQYDKWFQLYDEIIVQQK